MLTTIKKFLANISPYIVIFIIFGIWEVCWWQSARFSVINRQKSYDVLKGTSEVQCINNIKVLKNKNRLFTLYDQFGMQIECK